MVEVAIADPLNDDNIFGFFYLFLSEFVVANGRHQYVLTQDAGQIRVNYTFDLTTIDPDTGSNNYFDVYKFSCDEFNGIHVCNDDVMNPEDSWFVSNTYQRHFAENW